MKQNSKPLIGITCKYDYGAGQQTPKKDKVIFHYEASTYVDAVLKAGGIPILLPSVRDKKSLERYVEMLDGLLLTGGGFDIIKGKSRSCAGVKFHSQNPKRIDFCLKITKKAMKEDMPILGVCLGHQLINVARGGTINSDITKSSIKHNQKEKRYKTTHYINMRPASIMYDIFKKQRIAVNSFHYQAVNKLGKGLEATAFADDNIVEALESRLHTFVLGIQSHPEILIDDYPHFLPLFKRFVDEASQYKQKKSAKA